MKKALYAGAGLAVVALAAVAVLFFAKIGPFAESPAPEKKEAKDERPAETSPDRRAARPPADRARLRRTSWELGYFTAKTVFHYMYGVYDETLQGLFDEAEDCARALEVDLPRVFPK